MQTLSKRSRIPVSVGIILTALGLAYLPIPGSRHTVVVVSGTELQEPLEAIAPSFAREHPNIELELRFQGSQQMINEYLDGTSPEPPTVLIPANGQTLEQLRDRATARGEAEVFWEEPRAIAKTMLVGVAWPERGQVLFPQGRFDWQQLERALRSENWDGLGGDPAWGSFDFKTTDPTRSNSGQLTLSLWTQAATGAPPTPTSFSQPDVDDLFSLVKRSVYLPPRSTDVLLQEFIASGPNDADVAMVYESIALYRWSQSAATQNKPYQVYYLDPTIETVSTAAIVRNEVNRGEADAARTFLDFAIAPEQQQVFVRHGFRPVGGNLDLAAVPESPWAQGIPGAQVEPGVRAQSPPEPEVIGEVQRAWTRAD